MKPFSLRWLAAKEASVPAGRFQIAMRGRSEQAAARVFHRGRLAQGSEAPRGSVHCVDRGAPGEAQVGNQEGGQPIPLLEFPTHAGPQDHLSALIPPGEHVGSIEDSKRFTATKSHEGEVAQ